MSRINNPRLSPLLSTELLDEQFHVDPQQLSELNDFYQGVINKFQLGKVIKGRVIAREGSGLAVSIGYKSDGTIPGYEFTDNELAKFAAGSEIDVLLDRLEDENGNVVLSFQKAKALKAWETIAALAAADEPVRGMVTHKVKGGLSVDVGIPAFLPGSQIDVQRVIDFDQFVGQEVTCKILKVNKKRGNIIISRRKFIEEQRMEGKKKALETISDGQILQGIVKNITSYGVFVDVGGIDGLLHITDMSWGRIAHPSELVKLGNTITVKVISFDRAHEKISLGLKQLEPNPWEHVDTKYPIGTLIKGKISSITDYGLFVEVEKGVEGLVHISEISWSERISNLSKHFSVEEEVQARVVSLDKDNRRMSLSVKQIQEDPWKVVPSKFKVSEKISGKVTNITDFGIFVQLLEGVDGLVHISDISWTDHVSHPSERYKKGDMVEAIILSIDQDNRKVSLGIKQLDKDPWEKVGETYKVDELVEGTVSKITNFGAFIKLPTGIEGLIHISELASDKEVEKVEDVLKVGQSAQFRIIKVSPDDRKLGLSLNLTKKSAQASSSETGAPTPRTERPERAERAERPERAERAERSERSESTGERKQSSAPRTFKKAKNEERNDYRTEGNEPSTMKSSLQQALEDHMKKQSNDKKDGE